MCKPKIRQKGTIRKRINFFQFTSFLLDPSLALSCSLNPSIYLLVCVCMCECVWLGIMGFKSFMKFVILPLHRYWSLRKGLSSSFHSSLMQSTLCFVQIRSIVILKCSVNALCSEGSSIFLDGEEKYHTHVITLEYANPRANHINQSCWQRHNQEMLINTICLNTKC